MSETNPSPHIVLISSPGMGHIIPLTELTKLLVLHHNFTATIITFSNITSSLPSSISTIQLPLLDLPSQTHIVTRLTLTMNHSISTLRNILTSLKQTKRLVATIFDLFGVYFLTMVKELGIPTYLFMTSNFFYLCFMFHLPTLVETTTGEFRYLPKPLMLPGCVPLHGVDFLEPLQKRDSEVCASVVQRARDYELFDGILVNSFEALEAGAVMAVKKRCDGKPQVWPIGPVIESNSNVGSEQASHECIDWLNKQLSRSVVFLCFGSYAALSKEQIRELALGLEMSKQRFLWVVRGTSDAGSKGSTLFNPNQSIRSDDLLRLLPEGFVERMKETGNGMLVSSWAPQREVLCHRATGGFVSHCGWNSTLESLINGVPMVAWPLHSEQRMNAVLLVGGAKVALKVKVGENGLVGKEEVAKVVKNLMEGEEGKAVRENMQEMKKEALRAVERGGSSYMALEEVVSILKDSAIV